MSQINQTIDVSRPQRSSPSPSTDRTQLFPPHYGSNVLPNCPFFARLLRHARRGRTAVCDVDSGVTKTYGDVLSDALALRSTIEQALSEDTLDRLKREDDVFIGVLAAGGYEFTVAVLAVLALGAAVVPMTVANPTKEAAYFVTKSQQVLLISSCKASTLARSVIDYIEQHHGVSVPHLEVLPNVPSRPSYQPSEMVISSDLYLNLNSAGVVIFTSGTTGKPKGAVLRRAYIHETSSAIADGYEITPNDTLLHVLPVHHATGLGTSFFPFLISGATIEFKTGSFDASWIWDRFRKGGITIFSAVPTIFLRLMWHYQNDIASKAEEASYIAGANALSSMVCGSSALQQPVQDFWTHLRRGRPILVRYGSSEVPTCVRVSAAMDFKKLPVGCVGQTVAGVDAKINMNGELLIKSPFMFSKYLFDDQATAAAHDEDGYFKTGDLCREENGFYFIIGRASIDIIKSGGYKIGALEIEKECLELSYIREVMVAGVQDEEFGQRVAAAVVVRPNAGKLSIDQLRADLRHKLPSYKLPTLLRVVEGELPKGGTGKVQKKVLVQQYFKVPGWQSDPNIQAWRGSKVRAKM